MLGPARCLASKLGSTREPPPHMINLHYTLQPVPLLLCVCLLTIASSHRFVTIIPAARPSQIWLVSSDAVKPVHHQIHYTTLHYTNMRFGSDAVVHRDAGRSHPPPFRPSYHLQHQARGTATSGLGSNEEPGSTKGEGVQFTSSSSVQFDGPGLLLHALPCSYIHTYILMYRLID